MPSERLALALEQITSGDWKVFERFAAEFLAVEFPSLRTMAAPAGDKGRDGELYMPKEEPTSAIQYSVAQDWKSKIKVTVQRLSETMPAVTQLIYATNMSIGPSADELKRELRIESRIVLDVRDRSWFIDRELSHPQRQVAAAELAERFVDPLLSARGVRELVAPTLDSDDARIALLHLSLDAADKASDMGLTKSCFASLVLAALHDTDAQHRLTLRELQSRVRKMVPAGEDHQIHALAESAVKRLSRKSGPVHHHKSTDDYCLSHPARLEMHEATAGFVSDERSLEREIRAALASVEPMLDARSGTSCSVAEDLRLSIEQLLLDRGEAFARAVATGDVQQIDPVSLVEARVSESLGLRQLSKEQLAAVIYGVLQKPSESTQRHLRRLADAYTLFAFLRQTPDVQKVVVRLFSEGDVWLDTTIVLPLLAETLLSERQERHYTVLLRAAADAGLRLFVTWGVVEEVERHINRCIAFSRTPLTEWRNAVPFLYAVYASTGRDRSEFAGWASQFAGRERPKDDVIEYLKDVFGIQRRDLTDLSGNADTDLRAAVQEVWQQAHDRRRSGDSEGVDQAARLRLVAHDVENCVGVIVSRRQQHSSPMGYRAWFLTLDRIAFSLGRELRNRLGSDAPASPALSPDFLTELLRLGPLRTALERDIRVNLPLITDISQYEGTPLELIQLSEEVRSRCAGMEERLIRREVRDEMDRARVRLGPEAHGGLRVARERIEGAIASQSD